MLKNYSYLKVTQLVKEVIYLKKNKLLKKKTARNPYQIKMLTKLYFQKKNPLNLFSIKLSFLHPNTVVIVRGINYNWLRAANSSNFNIQRIFLTYSKVGNNIKNKKLY